MKNILPEFRILLLIFYTLSACFISSCAGKKQVVSSSSDSPALTTSSSKAEPESYRYFVFKDGMYVKTELDKKPEILGGIGTLYRDIRYPAYAREHGIQGTVIITVIVNEFGQLEDAFIAQHVGGGCSEEALRAIRNAEQIGFEPAEINGLPVKVKYDIPLKFILQ